MYETEEEFDALQTLLNASAAAAGPHLREVITDEHRLDARELCRRLRGMRLLALATVTADGRPLVGPVDGYLIHGAFNFSSARNSVRMGHLRSRPQVSATHLPGEHLAVTVHGRADCFELTDPRHPHLRRAMLDHYLPLQGEAFREWLEASDVVGARIAPDRMFTFSMQE